MLPLESVPNVSEGRDAATIGALAAAFSSRGATLLDVHSDADHHRSVFTLVGEDGALVDSLVAGIAAARERIDLRATTGCTRGSVPWTWCRSCRSRRRTWSVPRRLRSRSPAGRARSLSLSVFLYAESGGGRRPAFFRQGGPEELQRRVDAGELAPDFGPVQLDAAAGAVLVGARRPLVAFNVDLETGELEAARAIAASVRESSGGLAGVQAIGLLLGGTGRAQVSMNLVDLDATPLHVVVARVRAEASCTRCGGRRRRARRPAARLGGRSRRCTGAGAPCAERRSGARASPRRRRRASSPLDSPPCRSRSSSPATISPSTTSGTSRRAHGRRRSTTSPTTVWGALARSSRRTRMSTRTASTRVSVASSPSRSRTTRSTSSSCACSGAMPAGWGSRTRPM